MKIGVPYSSWFTGPDDEVLPVDQWFQRCPACGQRFDTLPRSMWKDFETPRSFYAEHYVAMSEQGL